jgi:hypothetical protein
MKDESKFIRYERYKKCSVPGHHHNFKIINLNDRCIWCNKKLKDIIKDPLLVELLEFKENIRIKIISSIIFGMVIGTLLRGYFISYIVLIFMIISLYNVYNEYIKNDNP